MQECVIIVKCIGIMHHFGEVNGNPLQCSCLENPVDRGAWWAAVHGGRTELDMIEAPCQASKKARKSPHSHNIGKNHDLN